MRQDFCLSFTDNETEGLAWKWKWTHRLYSPWNSPGQNTGLGSPSLLQGIFPTQGSNPGLPHCRRILYKLSHKGSPRFGIRSDQIGSVAQSCRTLCNPMDHSTPGLPVHYQLPKPTQTHVHWVGDAIQPSHPLLPSYPFAFNLSQHQGLFKWVQEYCSG